MENDESNKQMAAIKQAGNEAGGEFDIASSKMLNEWYGYVILLGRNSFIHRIRVWH